jgi:hypothetical protein
MTQKRIVCAECGAVAANIYTQKANSVQRTTVTFECGRVKWRSVRSNGGYMDFLVARCGGYLEDFFQAERVYQQALPGFEDIYPTKADVDFVEKYMERLGNFMEHQMPETTADTWVGDTMQALATKGVDSYPAVNSQNAGYVAIPNVKGGWTVHYNEEIYAEHTCTGYRVYYLGV